MKMRYTTPNGRLTFELEADTGKAAFAVIARIQELFEEPDCGQCGSKNIRCSVRHIEDYTYYSLVCECGAQLNFGQNKDGKGLFVKRKDETGEEVGKRGWYHWQPSNQDSEGRRYQPAKQQSTHSDENDVPF